MLTHTAITMATHTLFHRFLVPANRKLKTMFTDFLYISIGTFIITPVFVLYFLITLPFIVFRALVAFILSNWYRIEHGYRAMVSPGFSTAYAIEYLSSVHDGQPSKNTILSRQVIEGHVSFEVCKDKLESGWIKGQDENHNWKIPELRSFVDSWMGYCYWRGDPNFDFNSHVHYHKTEESEDVDEFTFNLFEKLMNTPFIPKRSPWDVHIIHGWKQESSPTENNNMTVTRSNQEMTIVITRTHHVLGDGKSIVHLIFQDLFGVCMDDSQKETCVIKVAQKSVPIAHKIKTVVVTILKLMWDFGCISSFVLWRAKTNTKFHVPKTQKVSYVHYMSELMSMDTVKNIRKKFGVSFSGVIISSLASSVAQMLDDDDHHSDKFLLAAPRPLPGHPTGRMVNHMTGAVYNIPVKLDMHPVQRLIESDKTFKMVNKSLFPTHVFPLLVHFLSYHIAPIAKFGFKSRQFGVSFSNNLGIPFPVRAFDNKYKVLEQSAACATYDGATGLVILIVSYANTFRFHGIANEAALSKGELKVFVKRVVAEINDLYELENLPSEPFIKC